MLLVTLKKTLSIWCLQWCIIVVNMEHMLQLEKSVMVFVMSESSTLKGSVGKDEDAKEKKSELERRGKQRGGWTLGSL